METPDRMPDFLSWHEEYIQPEGTQRVSRATAFTYGTRFAPPNVTQWTEREEPVPGYSERYVVQGWITPEGTIAKKTPDWKISSDEHRVWWAAALKANPVSKPDLFGGSPEGWGSFVWLNPDRHVMYNIGRLDINEVTWT